MNGRGQGLATLDTGGGASGAFNYNDVFEPSAPLHSQPSAPGLRAPAGLLRAPRGRRRLAGRRRRQRVDQGPAQAGADEALRPRGRALASRPRAGRRRASSPSAPTASPASPSRWSRARRAAAHGHGRRPRPPARAAGGDRPQRVVEQAAAEARVAPRHRPLGPAALPRRRRRPGRRGDDGQLARPPPAPARRPPAALPGDRDRRARPGDAEPHARRALRQPGAEDHRQGARPARRRPWAADRRARQ